MGFSRVFAPLLSLLFLSSVAFPSPLSNQRSAKQISATVFTCDSSDELLNGICEVGLRRINSELEAAGVSVDRDGILFTWEDPKDAKVDTGHSCTVTAKLPIVVNGRIDVKQRFGTRILGSCSNTGSDSYAFKAEFADTAHAMVGLALNPSLGMLDSGDYGLVIEPKVAVLFHIPNPKFNFRVSGVSPLTPVVTFVSGVRSTLFKTVTKIFTGESIESTFDELIDQLAIDFGLPIILGANQLPRPLEAVVWEFVSRWAQRELDKETSGFGADLEDKLQGDLKRIFKLGADGKRVFIIKKDIVELIRQFGVGADVFVEPPVSPAIACDARAREICRHPDLQVIYDQCIPLQQECERLAEDYNAKYTPANVIVSIPRVASLPPPRTPPPPSTNPPTTRTTFTTDCNPRPGQHVEC